jgi:hypothetical protein
MTQHYVKFLFPGSFWPEEQSKKISSRDEKFDIPKECFAYEFYDREEGELNGELVYGEIKNKSGRHYFGEVLTAKEVEEKYPDSRILLTNMRVNNWETVVRTRRGNFQPLAENDVVLNS